MAYRPLVLFVCTGNTCRSPMAERLYARLLEAHGDKTRLRTASAGLWAHNGQPATPEAVALMTAQGLDLTQHRARALTQSMVDEADLILVMERAHLRDLTTRFARAETKTYLLTSVAGKRGELLDPLHQGEEAYAACWNTLMTCLTKGYDRIAKLAEGNQGMTRERIRWPWQRR